MKTLPKEAVTDPSYRVPAVPTADNGVAWLRGSVARFVDGATHNHRRHLAVAELESVDLAKLRIPSGDPLRALAQALNLPEAAAPDAVIVSRCYQPHLPVDAEADAAVERLVAMTGGHHDERAAARIGLLVQAATAIPALVTGDNPPVPTTRRVTPSGEICLVDLAAVAFGAGAHACPGRSHALALATSQLPFHRLHHRTDQPLILPNAWDFASAAALCDNGFDAVGTTSFGVAAATGRADATGATARETMDLATNLVRLPVPVTIDVEAGLGMDPTELAGRLAELGVAGVNIEDGRGDHLADPVEQSTLLRRFKDAAPAIFLNARVDTHWLGMSLDSTHDRIRHYEAAGADGIFVPGLTQDLGIADVVNATDLPVNVLSQPDLTRLTNLGVRRVSTGSLLFRAALAAALSAADSVRRSGVHNGEVPTRHDIQSRVFRVGPATE